MMLSDRKSTKPGRPTRKDSFFVDNVQNMDEETLQKQIRDEIQHAERQQQDWEVKHASSSRTLSFLNDFIEFVGEFSGIIEIMRGVDQGYGGAAYSMLSLLMAVKL